MHEPLASQLPMGKTQYSSVVQSLLLLQPPVPPAVPPLPPDPPTFPPLPPEPLSPAAPPPCATTFPPQATGAAMTHAAAKARRRMASRLCMPSQPSRLVPQVPASYLGLRGPSPIGHRHGMARNEGMRIAGT